MKEAGFLSRERGKVTVKVTMPLRKVKCYVGPHLGMRFSFLQHFLLPSLASQ